MTRTGSWWLKVKQAQRHMVEIDHEIRRYTDKHAYRAVRVAPPKRNKRLWSYRLELTEQPNPMIAVMLGDFLFDLRSALDHVLSACAPNKRDRRSFPTEHENVLAADFPDRAHRAHFIQSLTGLAEGAVAVVVSFQSWNAPTPHMQPIAVVSRLNNRDKHRELAVVATGVDNVTVRVQARGGTQIDHPTPPGEFVKAGAVVLQFTDLLDPALTEADVRVTLDATPLVYVEVPRPGGNQNPNNVEIRDLLRGSIRQVRDILRQMEPFVRR